MELIKQLESLLFSSGKAMAVEELALLCKSEQKDIKKALNELKNHYKEKAGSLMVVDEGNNWKITVKEDFIPLVSKIVTETELSKTIIETLAVIAWKAPVLQSRVINIRTNKAYDHLRYLEEAGYITRGKQGRTKMIRLGNKFFEYFDLPPEKFKQRFEKFEDIGRMIIDREQEAINIKRMTEAKKGERKKLDEEKAKITEEEHKKMDESIYKLEKQATEISEEHEKAVKQRWEEEEEKQEWKAMRLRKEAKEKTMAEEKGPKKQQKLLKENKKG